VLHVAFDAPAMLGCYLELGWATPASVIDLRAEVQCRLTRQGKKVKQVFYELEEALRRCQLDPKEGLGGLELLFDWVKKRSLDPLLQQARIRGRSALDTAMMERRGIPINWERYRQFQDDWPTKLKLLRAEANQLYGKVFYGTKLSGSAWLDWTEERGIAWPQRGGRPLFEKEKLRALVVKHPEVETMAKLQYLTKLHPHKLSIGPDGRNRSPLWPFSTVTGRNNPSSNRFVLNLSKWVRGFVQPPPGMALAYIDFVQQEVGIAAALSEDEAMLDAYDKRDAYLYFAYLAGEAPLDATKKTHPQERTRYKECLLGALYGITPWGLVAKLGCSWDVAKRLLQSHRETFGTYCRWTEEVLARARRDGRLLTAYGWQMVVGPHTDKGTITNFLVQGTAAEILRMACTNLMLTGIDVCAPHHDAVLIQAPEESIQEVTTQAQAILEDSSREVLEKLTLRTDARIIHYPQTLLDDGDRPAWERYVGVAKPGGYGAFHTTASFRSPAPVGSSHLPSPRPSVGSRWPGSRVSPVPAQEVIVQREEDAAAVSDEGDYFTVRIPWDWLERACELPVAARLMAIALWYCSRQNRGQLTNLPFTDEHMAPIGIKPYTKSRGLAALKKKGLIEDYPPVSIKFAGSSRKFLYARVPMGWLQKAAQCGGAAVLVGLALWYQRVDGAYHAKRKLANRLPGRLGVSQPVKMAELRRLKKAELIHLECFEASSPKVAIRF
jgi:hypothetical protein